MTLSLVLGLRGVEARLSVDDPHNRDLHGVSADAAQR